MSNWQLQDAKARLSELVKKASNEGPQHITLHGQPAAVVLSEADYKRLKQQPTRFIDFIRSSPLKGVELDLTRDRSPQREIRM
jgi:antitoxin Phd